MARCVILAAKISDVNKKAAPCKVLSHRDYLSQPKLLAAGRPRLINLSRFYRYRSHAYYASLLAEARGHRIIPSVETIIDLSERRLYENAIPELEAMLNKVVIEPADSVPDSVRVYFGAAEDVRFDKFAKLLFDWFRAPALEVVIKPGKRMRISRIGFANWRKLGKTGKAAFYEAMERYSTGIWRQARLRQPPRWTFATLYDPHEELPPSTVSSLKHWARVAARLGVEVEPIGAKDLSKLANYDALFIRETTDISNHTYRFARRAVQEGMPVIDDPVSMIRCTNKVYLDELMRANNLPVPETLMISGMDDLPHIADILGFPLVVKIPDSSYSRGVKRVATMEEFKALVTPWLKDSDILLAQKYTPTTFDWRVGVLGGKPLFVCQYMMARYHWQIVKHNSGGKPPREGAAKAFSLAKAPPDVVDIGLKAANCIGDGFYGVDIKQTDDGIFVIEVNDNPNLDHGYEDAAEKDDVWMQLTQWFITRLEKKSAP